MRQAAAIGLIGAALLTGFLAGRVSVPEPVSSRAPMTIERPTEPIDTPPSPSERASQSPSPTAVDPSFAARRVAPSDVDWEGVLAVLSPVELPSDCPLPLDEAISLPNAPRDYRSGVHAGVDFVCEETGRDAFATLPGRVVVALDGYRDPSPEERSAVLGVAAQVGFTPPWTLAMLYGNFVVLDHGLVPGAGHVTSIYAHLAELDPELRPGRLLDAGQRIGEIGNHGTAAAAAGTDRPRSLHLHWELYVDGNFFAEGASPSETADLYRRLFGVS